jgi:hypothetical protein
MADERDEDQFDGNQGGGRQRPRSEDDRQRDQTAGSSGQPMGGNDSATGSGTPLTQGSGSEPPRSMGTRGTEFGQFGDANAPAGQQGQSGTGQADLGSQAATTLAGRSDQQDLGIDQPGSVGGASGRQGEGFIGAQGSGSDDYLQEGGPGGLSGDASGASSAEATGGADFARQGRGALDDEDDESGSGGGSF